MRENRRYIDRSRLNRIRQIRIRVSLTILTFGMIIAGTLLIGRLQMNVQADSTEPSYKYYKSIMVSYGDTLSGIADEMNIPDYDKADYISEVMNINCLSEDDVIKAGEYLVVPYYTNEYLG